MFKRSIFQRSAGHHKVEEFINKASRTFKDRDPNETRLSVSSLLVGTWQKTYTYVFTALVVCGSITYEQYLAGPGSVPYPVQDGRSLVT